MTHNHSQVSGICEIKATDEVRNGFILGKVTVVDHYSVLAAFSRARGENVSSDLQKVRMFTCHLSLNYLQINSGKHEHTTASNLQQ